jgi:hypothetical protein
MGFGISVLIPFEGIAGTNGPLLARDAEVLAEIVGDSQLNQRIAAVRGQILLARVGQRVGHWINFELAGSGQKKGVVSSAFKSLEIGGLAEQY